MRGGAGARSLPAIDLYPANPTPTTVVGNQGVQGTYGMKFKSSQPGRVLGVKFHQAAGSTTSRTIGLYSLGTPGTLLASRAVTSAAGWNSFYFTSPVYIAANTLYVAAQFNAEASFSANYSSMGSDFVVDLLTCPANNTGGQFNGVWVIAAGITYPGNTDTTVSPKVAVSPIFQPL